MLQSHMTVTPSGLWPENCMWKPRSAEYGGVLKNKSWPSWQILKLTFVALIYFLLYLYSTSDYYILDDLPWNIYKYRLTLNLLPPAVQHSHLSRKISQHLQEGLAQSFLQAFIIPRWWILMTLASDFWLLPTIKPLLFDLSGWFFV